MMSKDVFDQWWESANKPPASEVMIPAKIHNVPMTLTKGKRQDRAMVNEAVRTAASRTTPPAASLRPFIEG